MKKFFRYTLPIFLFSFLAILLSKSGYAQTTCPAYGEMCINRTPFALAGGAPAGGTYSGPGVSDGIFNPTNAGVGNHTLTYTYVNSNNQTSSCTFKIRVYRQPDVGCLLEPAYFCSGAAPLLMQTCFAYNATFHYQGKGIVDEIFYPAVAGPGNHPYTLTVTDADGCTAPRIGSVYVYEGDPGPITCPDEIFVTNSSDPKFLLTGGSPPPGTDARYFGVGVAYDRVLKGYVFNPSIAGNGSHTVNFFADPYDDFANVCRSECSFEIHVGTLPVTLVRFDADALDHGINITWATSMETDFDRFEIERSVSPKKGFTKIHALAGTNTGNTYSYTDPTALKGTPLYYRLKMVDHDGTFAYSKIAWALREGKDRLKVYPNPASGHMTIESGTELVELRLVNTAGVEMFARKIEKVKAPQLTLPALPAGIYLLRAKDVNGSVVFSKVLLR